MKRRMDLLLTLIGLMMLGVGLVLVKTGSEFLGDFKAFPYLFVGLGCGLFGHGMGNLISKKIMKSNPAAAKKAEIEQRDERNIMITNTAKAKAYDKMIFLFGALILSLALMNTDWPVLLLLIAAYLFVAGYSVYCRIKAEKEL